MSNFQFLKKQNKDLFEIIQEAEKLFRDEYFEQTMVQIRRFAENLCKELLGNKLLPDDSFDCMINKIKDNSFQNIKMKELSDDLYFIKKHGNNSAHASSAKKNGKLALECLERAYEIGIFFNHIKYGYDKKLDKSVFSEEILMTGKKSAIKTLKNTYSKELKKARKKEKTKKVQPKKKNQKNKRLKKPKKEFPKAIIAILIFVAIVLFGHYYL